MGALKRVNAEKVFSLGDIRLYECPLTYITVDTANLIHLLGLIDSTGQLLHPGGWGAQPPWLAEAYEIMRHETARTVPDAQTST